jgi:periplasmic divalent cation tolerance protein
MTEILQVSTTTDKREDVEKISKAMVEKRLAACVQIVGPITSYYRWKGNLENAEEWLLIIKTRSELYPQIEDAIKAVHSYETPEIIAVSVTAGSSDYLDWLKSETE